MWRSFLVQRRACTCPESGGSRQPLRRQVRYYSERAHVASRDLGTSVAPCHKRVLARRKDARNAEGATPHGVAPRHLRWSLASRNKFGGSCPPFAAVTRPGSLDGRFWRLLLSDPAFLQADPEFHSRQPVHHWHLPNSNCGAESLALYFSITCVSIEGVHHLESGSQIWL